MKFSSVASAFMLIISFLPLSQQQVTTPDGCFRLYADRQVVCGRVGERRSGVSEAECQSVCRQLSSTCKVIQYTPASRQCDIFFTPIPGLYRRSRFRRHAYRRQYGYQVQRRYYQPYYRRSTPTPATNHARNCAQGPTISPCPGVRVLVPTGRAGCATGVIVITPTTTTTTTTTTNGPPLATRFVCPRGKVPRFSQVESVELVGRNDFQFVTQDETLCTLACANNRLPDNRQSPCLSVEYNPATGVCVVSGEAFPPLGNGTPAENDNLIYFEKICVNQAAAEQCTGPYSRSPQRILVGFADHVTGARDMAECLEKCLNSQRDLGFTCASGMIYYETSPSTMNCILNIETADTQPSLFGEEINDMVDYFQPNCGRTNRRAVSNSLLDLKRSSGGGGGVLGGRARGVWGEWTRCGTLIHRSYRFRNCKQGSQNPNKCEAQSKSCRRSFAVQKLEMATTAVTPKLRRECNPRKKCCALRKSTGEKDCSPRRGGYRYISRGRRLRRTRCASPINCP